MGGWGWIRQSLVESLVEEMVVTVASRGSAASLLCWNGVVIVITECWL